MEKTSLSVKKLSIFSLLVAIMILLMVTGIGIVQLPFMPIAVTIMHVPVIVGACILGPSAGGILGFVFGLMSFLRATFIPVITSFLFTPFYSVGEFSGNWSSLVICFLPRILIGVFAGLLFKSLNKKNLHTSLVSSFAGIVGSLTNTILVLGLSAIFFGDLFLKVNGANQAIFLVVGSSVLTNGIPEAIVSAIICAAIVTPICKKYKNI